jgi:broad specificity phosphatase PhoE
MQHIYIVRHGTTEWMEVWKIQGSTNSPLSTQGKREAEKTAQALAGVHFNAVYCSPLGRTRETAAIICRPHNLQPEIVDDLHEMDFGWYEGSPDFSLQTENVSFLRKFQLLTKVFLIQASGERFANVNRRANSSWDFINSQCPQGTILIVAHEVILHYLIGRLVGKEQMEAVNPIHLQPCSITELMLDGKDDARIIRLNDTSHLA